MSTPVAAQLNAAIQEESRKFQQCFIWLEQTMPPIFFQEVAHEKILLIAHGLIGFDQQEYYCTINLKNSAIVMCLDSPDADLRILKNFATYGIKNYQCYVSSTPPPYPNITTPLRIAIIYFTETIETVEKPYPLESKEKLRALVKERNPGLTDAEFDKLIAGINSIFLRSLSMERLILALDMFFRAKTRDNCQYEVRYNEDWEETGHASMQIVLAWRNTPKHNFLYRLARVIHRHGLIMKRVNATYINPYSKESILIMSLGLHGSKGQAAWDAANIPDFLRELATVKYFASFDLIDTHLVSKNLINGNNGNLLRAMVNFTHQTLVYLDPNLYTLEKIEEDLCRHTELAVAICDAFAAKFHPEKHNHEEFLKIYGRFQEDVDKLDTGNEEIDNRRKNVLRQGISFVKHCLKSNFFRTNYTALSFRLDPAYLDSIPFDRQQRFPELPYGIFYIKGMHFFGFHIRFKDLARGGLRTVYLEQSEHIEQERNNIFAECYNLAWTQHLKNKDIPEGGAKGVIFLKPWDRLESEALILENELELAKIPEKEIQYKIDNFRKEQKEEYLYQAQRSFIEALITIINCDPDGKIRAKHIVDYWKRPEYLYLGPDENMHDSMIMWIAEFSKKYGYKPGSAFISSKPVVGINHKEYGVTSLGINVYMEAVLKYLGLKPNTDKFTIKMSGGPDGDVAGNQIMNLSRYYPSTAKLVALTDVSGTIRDLQGLDLHILAELFKQGKPIRYYPPENLSDGGFLLDRQAKRTQTAYAQQTLCWKKQKNKLIEEWLSGSEMNQIFRTNVHQTHADVFIPAGGRPRTLNESNIREFLDETGKPTAKTIIEGANLYLTPQARTILENLGVIIVKDSSANKAGVICSSFEVLCGLALGDDKFVSQKSVLVQEILERLRQCAQNEADLLLRTYKETGKHLTEISDIISRRINLYTYQILDHLDPMLLEKDTNNLLIRSFFNYCLPTLRNRFQKELLQEIPDHHKKAIISCYLAANKVYKNGLGWEPSIVDILPLLLQGT